jgi:hypothetical protein
MIDVFLRIVLIIQQHSIRAIKRQRHATCPAISISRVRHSFCINTAVLLRRICLKRWPQKNIALIHGETGVGRRPRNADVYALSYDEMAASLLAALKSTDQYFKVEKISVA